MNVNRRNLLISCSLAATSMLLRSNTNAVEAGLPARFRNDKTTFRGGADNLPKIAEALQKAGVTRMGTYIMPCHDELTYVANFKIHTKRLRECANIL